MSAPPLDDLITKIHASEAQMVLAITGGGSGAIGQLLRVPGGSRTVLEAIVPYSAAALTEFIGAPPEHFCSESTARMMAMAAFNRAHIWSREKTFSSLASAVPPACGATDRNAARIGFTWVLNPRPARLPFRCN